ncbi:metallophosphoesterase family protein [bacterium]|nr:metallophosphoesterase family protein [bacterium]
MFSTRNRTFKRLDEAYQASPRIPFDVENDRYIIFSDVHMADKVARVDDFSRNEMIYCHALKHYYDQGFSLVLNGDVEEGWEAKISAILRAYKDTAYEMERLFADEGFPRHVRIRGNHDALWRKEKKVQKYLWEAVGEVDVHQGLRLGDDIFITHGHQGEWMSDEITWLAAWAVRHGWRWVQRILRYTTASAAVNHLVRRQRDELLYSWSRKHRQIVIAGHTHRSMFGDLPESNQLVEALKKLEADLPNNPSPFQVQATIQHLRKVIQKAQNEEMGEPPVPSYFNGGSCVNTNGITGIEIDRGEISLIRWELNDAVHPEALEERSNEGLLFTIERKLYQTANLAEVIDRVKNPPHLEGRDDDAAPPPKMETVREEAPEDEEAAAA